MRLVGPLLGWVAHLIRSGDAVRALQRDTAAASAALCNEPHHRGSVGGGLIAALASISTERNSANSCRGGSVEIEVSPSCSYSCNPRSSSLEPESIATAANGDPLGELSPDALHRMMIGRMKGAGTRGGACSGSRHAPHGLAAPGSRG